MQTHIHRVDLVAVQSCHARLEGAVLRNKRQRGVRLGGIKRQTGRIYATDSGVPGRVGWTRRRGVHIANLVGFEARQVGAGAQRAVRGKKLWIAGPNAASGAENAVAARGLVDLGTVQDAVR